uniref:EF-hand domain-containing protein n=1 Tax=Arion vulgaris TaxID=1028688 RepID=A0A0B6ZAM9_9EUPU
MSLTTKSSAGDYSNISNDSLESVLVNTQRKIKEAFSIFDHESNKTVDVREVGTIIRSLYCCPSEAELHDMLAEIDEEEPTGYIRYDKFLPMMTRTLMERRYKASPEDEICKAFQVLDVEQKGYLTVEELTTLMTEEGECFNQEEIEEMLSAAVDPDKKTILYKDYASVMAVEEP